MDDYQLQLDFRPSFHRRSMWVILRSGMETGLFISVMEGLGKPQIDRTFEIPSDDAETIYQASYDLILRYSRPSNHRGLDGIFIDGSFLNEHLSLKTFNFWSPKKNDYPHELINVVLSPLKFQILDVMFNDYYEELWRYFHHYIR